MRFAGFLTPELLVRLERIDDGEVPVAEVARRLCAEAETLGVTRPSYERVRQLVRELRLERRNAGPGRLQLGIEVTTGLRPRGSLPQAWDDAVERDERRRERRKRWRTSKNTKSK